jgi:hypothetical protein
MWLRGLVGVEPARYVFRPHQTLPDDNYAEEAPREDAFRAVQAEKIIVNVAQSFRALDAQARDDRSYDCRGGFGAGRKHAASTHSRGKWSAR